MNSKVVRIIGALGALFNLEGVHAYLRHAGVVGATAPAEAGPAMPAFVTAAFAIARVGVASKPRWATRPIAASMIAERRSSADMRVVDIEGECPLTSRTCQGRKHTGFTSRPHSGPGDP